MKTRNRWKPSLPDAVEQQLSILRTIGEDEAIVDYICALRDKGWSLRAIADPLEITRERVRQLSDVPEADRQMRITNAIFRWSHIPSVPEKPVVEKPKRVVIEPQEVVVERLREIQPLAQAVRGNSPSYRAEAEEYSRLVAQEIGRGVSVGRLAKHLGVSHSALRFRLVRYGYAPQPPSAATHNAYRRILEDNRAR